MGFIAISSTEHREFGYQAEKPFAFAMSLDFLPLTHQELNKLNGVYPVCFKKNGDRLEFGLPTHFISANNALVHPENGKFLLSYVPAVLRRYPFQLAKAAEGRFSLVVFDGENGFAKQKGAAVVDVDGNLTNKGKQLRDFLVRLHDSFERVNQSLKVLNKLELLKPIHFQIQEEVSFKTRQDLFQIDEQKLNGLSAEDLAQLRDAGALPLIYANLLNAHLLPRLSQVVESYAKLKKESSNEIDLQKIFDDVDSDTLKF